MSDVQKINMLVFITSYDMLRSIGIIIVLLMMSTGAFALSNITACGVISSSDTHILQNNINTTGTCLTLIVSDIVIDCQGHTITYGDGGGSTAFGVSVGGQSNISVKNCDIQDGGATGTTNRAIYYSNIFGGSIVNNTLNASGTSAIEAVYIYRDAELDSNITVANNSIYANGQGSGPPRGVYIIRAANNIIENNTISVTATDGSTLSGILLNLAKRNTLRFNTLLLNGTGTSGFIINIITNSHDTVVVANTGTVKGSITDGTRGVILDTSDDVHVENNTFHILTGGPSGGAPRGFSSLSSDRAIVRGNTFIINASATLEYGVLLQTAQDVNITGNTISILSGNESSRALRVLSTAINNNFENNIVRSPNRWIQSDATSANNAFINNTFADDDGSIRYDSFTISGSESLQHNDFNVTGLTANVNVTNNTFLNTSARITFSNTGFVGHKLFVDYEDDGTFVDCNAPLCVEISDTAGTVVFDVLHFTTFRTAEFIDPVPEFGEWALMILLMVSLVGIVVMRRS